MSLSDRLNEDMKKAMRNQDKFKLSVIRMIRASVMKSEIDQRTKLSDEQIIDILNREVKQRKDSLSDFEKAGRTDLSEPLKQEIEIVLQYLPAQLSREDIEAIVQETILEVGASTKSEMGKVMSALMPKVKGRADGRLVNTIVQQLLQ